jgi:hypothetical protein
VGTRIRDSSVNLRLNSGCAPSATVRLIQKC